MGFAVCEVAAPRPDGSCSCRLDGDCPSPGKHPVGRNWLKIALGQRARGHVAPPCLRFAPVTSYGLVPVPGSGMIVIDRDDPAVLLPMPATFEVHRPSADPGKGHYYYRLADGIAEDEVPRAFAGGEVRVAGSGHVVGPGCRHASGDLYVGSDRDVGIADRELIDALKASSAIRRSAGGAVEAVEGGRHAFLVGQARAMRGWGWDADQIEDGLRELDETVCVPRLGEAAEFGRMAEWAVRAVRPDDRVAVRRVGRLRQRRGR